MLRKPLNGFLQRDDLSIVLFRCLQTLRDNVTACFFDLLA
jgi:hypothetical protein